MSALQEIAYAKLNLALHVRRRRDDGYHELETLFVFADDGDVVTAQIADADALTISGEFAEGLSNGSDNLVLRALASMRNMVFPGHPPIPPLAIHLEKRLPVAAGIGGGSADAAALIRLVDRHFHICGNYKELVLANSHLGADIGACIVSQTRLGFGAGEDLRTWDGDNLGATPVLLVNPRIALSTGPVFAAWDGVDRGALLARSARDIALLGRNDLETPAISLVPEIGEVLNALKAQAGADLVRMSGSGATCFALFSSIEARDTAHMLIRNACPKWWTMASSLR